MKQSILIDQKKSRILITRKIIQALGNPSHILLLVSPQERALVILCGNDSDKRAYRIPPIRSERQREVELYSKSLVQSILRITDGWEKNQTYRAYGEFIKSENIFKFNIHESEPLRGNQ